VQNNPQLGKFRLVIYSVETGEGKTLVAGDMSQLLNSPAWSPDGKTIVCVTVQRGDALSGLVAIDPLSGKQWPFSESKWGFLSQPVWLPDGSGLLALSHDRESNFSRGRVDVPTAFQIAFFRHCSLQRSFIHFFRFCHCHLVSPSVKFPLRH